jgi:hypothetical protein
LGLGRPLPAAFGRTRLDRREIERKREREREKKREREREKERREREREGETCWHVARQVTRPFGGVVVSCETTVAEQT